VRNLRWGNHVTKRPTRWLTVVYSYSVSYLFTYLGLNWYNMEGESSDHKPTGSCRSHKPWIILEPNNADERAGVCTRAELISWYGWWLKFLQGWCVICTYLLKANTNVPLLHMTALWATGRQGGGCIWEQRRHVAFGAVHILSKISTCTEAMIFVLLQPWTSSRPLLYEFESWWLPPNLRPLYPCSVHHGVFRDDSFVPNHFSL